MDVRPGSCFPFAAIVGQETLKTALMVNAVDERVGGVLIRGQRGTAKSTAVRALAAVLPEMDVVEDCRYGCDPCDPASWCRGCRERFVDSRPDVGRRKPRLVNLPVSATEDRLVGTIDLESALKDGRKSFEPGLLADANRGILYVDEVNLLDDHLVDTLLDAAAMGVNIVQREGIAYSHPSRFILVGTMNPEEGDVRPQLLDRFGLCVDVEGIAQPEKRVEIVKRRHAFERDAADFARRWADEEAALETRLRHARLRLERLRVPDALLTAIAEMCAKAGVDGHRADICLARSTAALAALEDSPNVSLDHVRRMAPLVLAHRMRRSPLDDPEDGHERIRSLLGPGLEDDAGDRSRDGSADGSDEIGDGARAPALAAAALGLATEDVRLADPMDRLRRSTLGRRQASRTEDGRGRYSRAETPRPDRPIDLAIDATLRAAAPNQSRRESTLALDVRAEDIRSKVRTRRVGASIVFCVDASGSMNAAHRMETATAAVLHMLTDAYQRRDRVGLVSFRGDRAEVLLTPTASVELARLRLKAIATGGATPLAAGIARGVELLEGERRRCTEVIPWLVLVTDGRANVGLSGGLGSEDARAMATKARAASLKCLLIDTDTGPGRNPAAREIAAACGGQYVRLSTFDAASVAGAVRSHVRD